LDGICHFLPNKKIIREELHGIAKEKTVGWASMPNISN
jgi:hypothetical protein